MNLFNTATFLCLFPSQYVVGLRWEVIVDCVDIGRTIDHHYLNFLLEVIVHCVDIGRTIDHHYLNFLLEVIFDCVDIGRTIDHHYLNFLFRGDCWLCWYW